MSNHQQIDIVRDTATSNNEVDALAAAQAAQETPQAETRPEWLPEKFTSPEELAVAYASLETKLTSSGKSLDTLDAYSDEFAQTGTLSEDSVQEIIALGIPENTVRAYVAGQEALAEGNLRGIMDVAGGEEQYAALTAWAQNNIPEEHVDAYNSIMENGDTATIKLAIAGLKARYEQSNGSMGKPGRLLQGGTTTESGGTFRSVAEIVNAMSDPRYSKDPAYRADVERRISTSNAFGGSR
jgi:hypothetical protein